MCCAHLPTPCLQRHFLQVPSILFSAPFLGLPPSPVRTFLMSSCHSVLPYVLLISIWNTSYSSIKAARRVRDCRPAPPSPTSSALPPGEVMMRQMRQMCSSAN